MNFSQALHVMRYGDKITRSAWKTDEIPFIYLVQGSDFVVNRAPLNTFYEEGTKIKYQPHIDIRHADGTNAVWSPTHADILATDWEKIT